MTLNGRVTSFLFFRHTTDGDSFSGSLGYVFHCRDWTMSCTSSPKPTSVWNQVRSQILNRNLFNAL